MSMNRVVALVDMDCFYVQVEQRLQPQYQGKPCAVVQYNTWKGGGIIAVGYEARACGVTRQMRGDDAKRQCKDIHLFQVPEVRGKADLTKFREAGAEVIEVLSRFSKCIERASVDEAYIDLTSEVDRRMADMDPHSITTKHLQNTFVVADEFNRDSTDNGNDERAALSSWLDMALDVDEVNSDNRRLAIGALIAEEMRAAVYTDTGFRCSAGIAHNKMLAKFACGMHKPNKQTVLPQNAVPNLFSTLPIRKIRHFGGKFGAFLVENFKVENMGDLCQFSLQELQAKCGDKSGLWVYEICRGVDNEVVSARLVPKSIGCSKNFQGKACLDTKEKVKYWLEQFAVELMERLTKDKQTNKRQAKSLTVSMRQVGSASGSSRVCLLKRYDKDKIISDSYTLLQKFDVCGPQQAAWSPPVLNMGLSAGKFIDLNDENTSSITGFLSSQASPTSTQLHSPTASQASMQKSTSAKKIHKKNSIQGFFKHINQSPAPSEITSRKTPKRTKEEDVKVKNNTESKKGTSFFQRYLNNKSKEVFCSETDRCDGTEDNAQTSEEIDTSETRMKNGEEAPREQMDKTEKEKEDSSDIDTVKSDEIEEQFDQGIDNKDLDAYKVTGTSENFKKDKISQSDYEDFTYTDRNKVIHECVIDVEDLLTCEKCNKQVSAWDLPEHLDFHFAEDLQKEQLSVVRPANKQVVTLPSKRKSSSSTSTNAKKKTKTAVSTIDSFFRKP